MKQKTIQICPAVGKCISVKRFAKEASALLKQPAENIEYALSFMVPELGLVGALEAYGETCGIQTI